MEIKYRVPQDSQGRKLQNVLRTDMQLSASMVRRLKRADGIFVDGKSQYTNYILRGGETITADLSRAEPECDNVPQEGTLDILYENEGILLVNKPSGMITHPSRAQYMDTLSNYVAGYLKRTTGDGTCHSVNRLDRGTSGIVLFAKNSFYMTRAIESLKKDDAFKEYIAIVLGSFPEEEGTIDLPIYRPDDRDIIRTVDSRGQKAVTHYKTIKKGVIAGEIVSQVSFILETGRTHQIRVHCLHSGCPILGDNMYFTQRSSELSSTLGISPQALHAFHMGFCDPVSGKFLDICADIKRPDMIAALESME